MAMQLVSLLEFVLFISGILLILVALIKYTRRSQDYQSFWRVFVNRLKEGFSIAEFKLYRLGVALLIFALLVRFANQLFFPS